jgi:integrase
LGENNLIVRFLKGVFLFLSPKARYTSTWSVDVVLDFIISLGQNCDMNLKQLSHKLVILLALCCPRRVSELAALSLNSVQRSSERWVFYLEYRNKTRISGPPQSVLYEAHDKEPLLCPLRTICDYLARTKDWRSDNDNSLIRSYTTKHSVTPSTVARWIRAILEDAGIDVSFRAHSTRSASTSKAFSNGAAMIDIFKAASWSERSSTFSKYYKRETSYQNQVLER